MPIREPEPYGAQRIEFFSNATDQSTNRGIRIDQGGANNGQPTVSRKAYTTLFVHQERKGAKCFGDDNRFTFAQIQPLLTLQVLNPRRVRRVGYRDPFPERRKDRRLNRITGAPLNHFIVNRWRNNKRAVNLVEEIEVRQEGQVVQRTAVGNNRAHYPLLEV